jgi:hypothetical protein
MDNPIDGQPEAVQSRDSGDEIFEKNWKDYLGLTLFGWSIAAFPVAALLPMLPLSPAGAAVTATAVIISAEIAFWACAALLGRPFVNAIKAKWSALFTRRKPAIPQPISKGRHYTGVSLLIGSGLFYYVAAACVFLDLPKDQMLAAMVATLITGELVFIASLFILGADFWARLKKLFQWPGAAAI